MYSLKENTLFSPDYLTYCLAQFHPPRPVSPLLAFPFSISHPPSLSLSLLSFSCQLIGSSEYGTCQHWGAPPSPSMNNQCCPRIRIQSYMSSDDRDCNAESLFTTRGGWTWHSLNLAVNMECSVPRSAFVTSVADEQTVNPVVWPLYQCIKNSLLILKTPCF